MKTEKITPVNVLEQAVLDKDNGKIVELIASGAALDRPDIMATQEAFSLRYPVAILLLESAPCMYSDSAVSRLEDLSAHPEMIELVKELQQPLPENPHPKSGELVEALLQNDEVAAANLVINDQVTLSSAPLEYFDCLAEFPEFLVDAILEDAIDERLKSRLFLYHRAKAANDNETPSSLIFDMIKIVFSMKDSPERSHLLHTAWRQYTAPAYTKNVESNPAIFTEEYLADMIIDQDIEFDVRPFSAFSPYCQAMMRNNGGVSLEQFDQEAEIEKYDAKAVFELLRGDADYADRVNWELVNKTAKASEFLKFLAKFPWYADKADWQMINVQADAADWMEFLDKQPGMLDKCSNHSQLYLFDPDCWEGILKKAQTPSNGLYAHLWYCGEEWLELFKVKVSGDKAEFFEIGDLGSYEDFAELAAGDFSAFRKALAKTGSADRFVNIIK